MAYDAFVSYAHVDDEPLPGAGRGWVTTFVGGLKIKLAQELGRWEAFRLWMDYELRGNEAVTPKIHEILDQSGVLVLFLSNAYLTSSWCRDELARFAERGGAGLGRVFVVYRSPVEAVPEALADLKKYEFWSRDEAGQPRTLAVPVPDPTDRTYYDLQEDLARDLARAIRTLRRAEPEAGVDAAPPPESFSARPRPGYVVFVDAGEDDLDLAREAAACLRRLGFGFELPLSAAAGFDPARARPAELRRDLNRNLKECDAVLMLWRQGPVSQLREHLGAWRAAAARRGGPAPELALVQQDPDENAVGVSYPGMRVLAMPELHAPEFVHRFAEVVAVAQGPA